MKILKFVGMVFAAIVVLGIIIGACGDVQPEGNIEQANTETTSNDAEPTEPVGDTQEPEPEPEAEPIVEGSLENIQCDMLLWTQGDNSEFVAEATVVNEGNIGIEAVVTATFDKLGKGDYEYSDTIKVKPGQTKDFDISETIGHDEVSRHQNGGYECDINAEIIDTFGDVEQ